MATLHLDVVSPERRLYSGDVADVYARSLVGEFGILPNHEPFLVALGIGPVRAHDEQGEEFVFAVHEGFLEFRENSLTVLADAAERVDEIDLERARERKRELEDELAREEEADTRAALARATLRADIGGA
jgi:F-type H+-transporting ATPase subunit epsilon